MYSTIFRTVKPTRKSSFDLAKRSFTEKSVDSKQSNVKRVCSDSPDKMVYSKVSNKLIFSEEHSPSVWTAQNISLEEVVQFMRSKGANVTSYIIMHGSYKE